MLRLPMTYWRFPPVAAEQNLFEAARKSGDIAKGERVRFTGVTSKGKLSVEKLNGVPSEYWHDLEAFYPTYEVEANDNAPAQ